MPTPPRERERAAASPHRERQVAESFGADPDRYDRARPRYPPAMVAAIVAAGPGRDVLDVGCGTGISARAFRTAGCRVLGIDADPRMAAFARGRGLAVEVATFEAWDPAGREFDAVVAGQSWHWVDPVAGAARAARVLRPGGRLAAFWNVFPPPPDLADAFSAVHRRLLPGPTAGFWARPVLDTYAPMFATAFDGMRAAGGFGEPEQWRFAWERAYTRDEWLDQLVTGGDVSRLPTAQVAELLAGVGAAAVDARGGAFTMEYTAVVVTAVTLRNSSLHLG